MLTIRISSIQPTSIQNLSILSKLPDPPHHNINPLLHLGLQLPHIRHAKERIQCRASDLMSVMINRSKHAMVQPKGFREPCILVAFAAGSGGGVDFIVEGWVGAVEFPRGDSDYGTVFLVEFDKLEGVLAVKNEVVVEFVPG